MQKHILYSFRRCPFAIRARWALKVCDVSVELREVDLKNKPSELLKWSKSNTVPLLISEDITISESLDIIFWALSNTNNLKQKYFKDEHKNEILSTIKENDTKFKYHLDRFKYSTRFNENDKEYHFIESKKLINKWDKLLSRNNSQKNWLIGENESIADWCLWPFVRQYKIACESSKISNYFEPGIKSWLHHYETHNDFKVVMEKYKIWEQNSEKLIAI